MFYNEYTFYDHPDYENNHYHVNTEQKAVPLRKESLRFNYQSREGN